MGTSKNTFEYGYTLETFFKKFYEELVKLNKGLGH